METEIWKEIEGYEGLYEVSNLGKIRSLNYNHKGISFILKPSKSNKIYSIFNLCTGGISKTYRVHRLVAKYFIPNPNNLPCVCHRIEDLDENGMLYNGADNIFWGTHQDNMKDMVKKKRSKTGNPKKTI